MSDNKRLEPLRRRLDYIASMPKPNRWLLEEANSIRWVLNNCSGVGVGQPTDKTEIENNEQHNS